MRFDSGLIIHIFILFCGIVALITSKFFAGLTSEVINDIRNGSPRMWKVLGWGYDNLPWLQETNKIAWFYRFIGICFILGSVFTILVVYILGLGS